MNLKKQAVINPSTGETISEVVLAGDAELEQAITAGRKAFDSGSWRELSLSGRRNYVSKISRGILDKAAELAQLETLNTGKPIKETTFMDIPSAAKTFEFFAAHLEEYLKEDSRDVSQGDRSRLVREPAGLVVLIIPWNYPLLIASWKMAQALSAGNTVILKPSSMTPLSALELGKIAQEAGIPAGVVNVVCGNGDIIGEKLCSDNRVDMVSFTGSNAVGKKILEYSSRSVKKLIMELGGKSAGIIFKDADFEASVNGSLCSIFLNQGQMCTGMSRIMVEESIYDRFVEDFTAKAKRIKLGPGVDYETQMGPLISQDQRDKVRAFVEKARKEGAKLLCGGKVPVDPVLKKGFFFEPTVLSGAGPATGIFNEEVFGPVAVINKFSSAEEAAALANKSEFGLAACLWTGSSALAEKMSRLVNAGTIWINTYGMFYNEVPYGGFKQSGFGKELGKEGFYEYTRLKNVISGRFPSEKPLVSYWYGF
ncbi:MAG: aldehyde dehydrogenase family protein [Candidatus Omnitrophica bacterium]|nr:aldehyde dehydrogenase family protein [Candidatus Omnitrophota bacterium]